MTWNSYERKAFANISATPAQFTLRGGQYAVTVNATFGGGSITLQKLSNDSTTLVTCLTAFTAAGYATVNLPNGTYSLTIATATGVYCEIAAVVTSM
jgi:hypothetical protein